MFWICAGNTIDNSGIFSLLRLHRVKAFYASHPTSPARRLKVQKETADPSWPKGYSTPCGRERHLKLWCLSSQVTVMCGGALLSWRWLNSCWPLGNWEEEIPCFALLVDVAFALLIKLPLSQPMSFPTFSLLIPQCCWGEEAWASSSVGFSCWLGLNHRAYPSEFRFHTGHRWAAAFAGKKGTDCQKYWSENANYKPNYVTQLKGAKNPPSPFTTPYPFPFILCLSLRANTASNPGILC